MAADPISTQTFASDVFVSRVVAKDTFWMGEAES